MRTPDHTASDPLEAAVVALEHGRAAELVMHLREAWRATRDPGLADTYELLLRELSAAPLAGRNPAERARSWIERAQRRAGDPLELPILLAEPWTPELDELQRLELLEPWSPDPLLAAALTQRLRFLALPQSWDHHPLWTRMLELLAAQGDPRQLADLNQLRSRNLRRESARAARQLAPIRTLPLDPRQRERATKLARRANARREHEARTAELLAAVYAAPDHDEPRLVYADWLTSHGDPRGEFITLQIDRARTGAPVSAREQELLDRHGPQWAGRIHTALGFAARTFERGFLARASVEAWQLDGAIVEWGEWSTLRTLDGHVSAALAARGPLDHLRELYGFLQLDRFVALRADNRLGSVECYECSIADPNLPLDIPLGLRTLLVRRALDDVLLRLLDSPAITGLERFGVCHGSEQTAAADHRERRSLRHRFELLRGRLPLHIRELLLLDVRSPRASRPQGWMLTFTRDELDVFSHLRVDWGGLVNGAQVSASTELLELLAALGVGQLRKLTLGRFDAPERPLLRERLREWADASGCELAE